MTIYNFLRNSIGSTKKEIVYPNMEGLFISGFVDGSFSPISTTRGKKTNRSERNLRYEVVIRNVEKGIKKPGSVSHNLVLDKFTIPTPGSLIKVCEETLLALRIRVVSSDSNFGSTKIGV